MASLIAIYFGTVTSGAIDGTRASEGTEQMPVVIGPLNTTFNEESAPAKVAVRCDSGYYTDTGTTITPMDNNNNNGAMTWSLAPNTIVEGVDAPGTFGAYGAGLTFAAQIMDVNTLFWCKAKVTNSEIPINDISTDFVIAAVLSPEA